MASSFDLTNRAMDGKLEETLRQLRADGKSLEAMSQTLKAQGYDVSLETVRRWCQRIGLPTHRVPATSPAGHSTEPTRAGKAEVAVAIPGTVGGELSERTAS